MKWNFAKDDNGSANTEAAYLSAISYHQEEE